MTPEPTPATPRAGTAPSHLTVKYSCEACGAVDREVVVLCRSSEEDVKVWIDGVGARIGQDHAFRSPRCRSRTMTNLKIPIANAQREAGWIGGPIDQPKEAGND